MFCSDLGIQMLGVQGFGLPCSGFPDLDSRSLVVQVVWVWKGLGVGAYLPPKLITGFCIASITNPKQFLSRFPKIPAKMGEGPWRLNSPKP